jgi:GNAT superfamily N-acetyltransferase
VQAAARTTTDAERAVAFDAAVFERAAERLERLDGATVLTHPSLPDVPHLNVAHIEGLGADEIEALDVPMVSVEDEAVAAALRGRGWEHHPILLLGRDGSLEPPGAESLAEEVPYGQVRGLRDEWIRSEGWASSEDVVRDAHEGDRRLFAATPTRAFAVFELGRPVAYALLLDGGRDGMLEDVYTTPSARGRGSATAAIAAVLHAARAAGHERVFVPTDAEGGARGLYERLGFEPLAVRHRLTRPA